MAIIPAVYRAEVTGSDDLRCFTEVLRSTVGHLYGVDVGITRDEFDELDEFRAASSAFVAALAQCSIHALNIRINAENDEDLYFLSELSSCSSLGLEIRFDCSDWDPDPNTMMEAMAVLKGNPALCSLTISSQSDNGWYHRGYGDALAMAMSQLRFSGSIHTLDLDFDGTCVTNIGAVCLSQLRESPALRALTLSLRRAYLDSHAMEALSTLRDTPVLQSLSLTLEPHRITNDMVCNIAKILQSRSLHEFTMRICNEDDADDIDDADDTDGLDDTVLCEISRCAGACGTIRHLSLDLGYLQIGYAGVDALVQLINQRQVAVDVSLLDCTFKSGPDQGGASEDGWHYVDDDGLTLLMHAVQKNAVDCVNFLSPKHTTAQNMKDPVLFAIINGLTACMALLLKNRGTKEIFRRDTGRLVHIAIRRAHAPLLALLLENKAAPDTPDRCGIRPLWYMAGVGNSACTSLLLDSRACVNGMRKYGCTPLSIAAANGHVECVELLLQCNANVNKFSERIPGWVADGDCDDDCDPWNCRCGRVCGMWCDKLYVVCGRRAFFSNLGFETDYSQWDGRYDPELNDNDNGWDCWHNDNGCVKMNAHGMRNIYDGGMSIQLDAVPATDTLHHYRTSCGPLWRAAESGHVDCVRLLLESNAHVDARNAPDGRTALWISVTNRHTACVKLLLETKANVHLGDRFGISPMCIATRSDCDAISQLFPVCDAMSV